MGAAWSSYRLKRKEKALHKKMLRNKLREAEQCIENLQEQHRWIDELLKEQQSSFLEPQYMVKTTETERQTADMEQEIKALREKLYLEEIALAVTNERCRKLEKNLSLLQLNENQLEQETSLGSRRLSELRLKMEASQFAQYKKTHPIETWTVCSLPELYRSEF